MDMNDSGWRKRQIALDKMAENARELGLDYEPSIIEMARRAGAVFPADGSYHKFERHEDLETFAKLVRADDRDKWMERTVILIRGEREACAKLCDLAMLQNQETINELEEDEHIAQCFIQGAMTQLVKTSNAIRERGQE